jgi:hypothetical protein
MVTLILIITAVAAVLLYREVQKEKEQGTKGEGQGTKNDVQGTQDSAQKEDPQVSTLNSQLSTLNSQLSTLSSKPSNILYEDHCRRLSFEQDGLSLRYNGTVYRFSGDGHEPMVIILKNGEAVCYIHNAFDIEYECGQFRKNPNYRCTTITGRGHDAKSFCRLLTTAIDDGYDWQIDELEMKVDELTRYETREVWYREKGIEFGRYGDEPGGREQHHYEYEILYIIVDGHKYLLKDNVNEPNALYLFYPGGYGRRQAVLRIHNTNGAVLAAYAENWKSGKEFTPFGHPMNTKQFCAMIAYALRSGKKDFNLRELEKVIESH